MFVIVSLNHSLYSWRRRGEHLAKINPKNSNLPKRAMEESKQQMLFQMQQQQQRQQQLFLMQHLQKQQQQAAMSMSRFPSNVDAHFRPPGLIQNRPVNPTLLSSNLNPNYGPNLTQHTNSFQQPQQQNVNSQQMMMMMQQQQQQQQQKSMRPTNQLELQFAYQDAWRVCHPDFKRPFASLEDACERFDFSSFVQFPQFPIFFFNGIVI